MTGGSARLDSQTLECSSQLPPKPPFHRIWLFRPRGQDADVDVHDVVAAVAALRVAGSVAVEASIEEWLASCWPDGTTPPADSPTKVRLT